MICTPEIDPLTKTDDLYTALIKQHGARVELVGNLFGVGGYGWRTTYRQPDNKP